MGGAAVWGESQAHSSDRTDPRPSRLAPGWPPAALTPLPTGPLPTPARDCPPQWAPRSHVGLWDLKQALGPGALFRPALQMGKLRLERGGCSHQGYGFGGPPAASAWGVRPKSPFPRLCPVLGLCSSVPALEAPKVSPPRGWRGISTPTHQPPSRSAPRAPAQRVTWELFVSPPHSSQKGALCWTRGLRRPFLCERGGEPYPLTSTRPPKPHARPGMSLTP